MSRYGAIRCFETNNTKSNTSMDYINKKKAKTLYENYSKNAAISNINLKNDGSQYKGPIFINNQGCLGAIGGYNTNNYELLLNFTKGKYYNTYDMCNDISLNRNLTYKIYEGPFFINDQDFNSDSICNNTLKNNYIINTDSSYISTLKYDPLTNFNFPLKFNIINTH